MDSALRYANVFKFAVGASIWSQLAHVEVLADEVTRAVRAELGKRILERSLG